MISLQPDGRAQEKIGGYEGYGTWKPAGKSARLTWDSGWICVLRPTAKGGWELDTRKKGTVLEVTRRYPTRSEPLSLTPQLGNFPISKMIFLGQYRRP